MNIRTIIFGCTLLFSLPLFAQESKDVIVMKNGDRITGEIKGLSAGVLSVRVRYIDGRIAVQWSQVAHLESNRLYLVQTESGAVYTGKLSTSGESDDPPIRIEVAATPEREVEIAQRQIISLGPTSESFWHRFDGAVNTGICGCRQCLCPRRRVNPADNYLEAHCRNYHVRNTGAIIEPRPHLLATPAFDRRASHL
jgi:hypothetical protein